MLSFLLSLPLPLHLPIQLDEAVVISLASCVMLLSQPDGIVIPQSSGLFLAPSLALSSATLYSISMFTVLSQLSMVSSLTQLETAGMPMTKCEWAFYTLPPPVRVTELVLLLAVIPGQVVLIRCLWTGRSFTLSLPLILLYLIPNGFLPKFGQGSYNTVLGSSAVLCFSLLALTDLSAVRTA